MAGHIGSFIAGLLITTIFSPIVAIIVGIVWERKTRAFWIGAFFGFIALVFLVIVFGILGAFGILGGTLGLLFP